MHTIPWPRAIVFVDMDAFFASIEQLDDPGLRGRPVAVTNGAQGTCIITCSYEARAHGVHTGMRIKEALQLCPSLVQRAARPQRYAQLATPEHTARNQARYFFTAMRSKAIVAYSLKWPKVWNSSWESLRPLRLQSA